MPVYHFRSTPLETDEGVEWAYVATFEDDDGTPLDFTGWDFEMTGRRAYGAADPPYFHLTEGDGLVVADDEVEITISDTLTAAIPPGNKYVWELRGENAAGDSEITIKGPWHHHAGVI